MAKQIDSENPFAEWGEDYAEAPAAPHTTEAISKKEQRYYWLKLKEGFFDSKYIKALRARENGDKMTIVYLSMQLRALKTDGMLKYTEIMPSFEEEIALDINESVEVVKSTLEQLKQLNLIEVWDDSTVYMVCKQELLDYGSETATAERMRKSRSKSKV